MDIRSYASPISAAADAPGTSGPGCCLSTLAAAPLQILIQIHESLKDSYTVASNRGDVVAASQRVDTGLNGFSLFFGLFLCAWIFVGQEIQWEKHSGHNGCRTDIPARLVSHVIISTGSHRGCCTSSFQKVAAPWLVSSRQFEALPLLHDCEYHF